MALVPVRSRVAVLRPPIPRICGAPKVSVLSTYTGLMAIGVDASRAFEEAPTGIGVYSTEICSGLIADPPAPLVLYLNRATPPGSAPPLGVDSVWRPIPLPRGWTRLRLGWEIRKRPPELLFIPAYRLPPGRLPRSVVTIHGVEHRMAPQAYPGRAGSRVDSFVHDTLARAAAVIAPSETTKADLVHLYGADPARITVIPHGVAEYFRPDPEGSIPDSPAEGEGPYLLAVGAHHPRKNIPFLVRCFARAFAGSPDPPRLVVTNALGEVAQALDRQAREAGVRLKLLAHVRGEELASLYRGALAACVPSLYEGFGLPALEAMACGTPVVAGAAGAVQEIATGAALLVAPTSEEEWAEALVRLAEDCELRAHLRSLGLARARSFTWERSVRQHRTLLARELELSRSAQRK